MSCILICACFSLFFFNDTATTEIYTLSLHDALPISVDRGPPARPRRAVAMRRRRFRKRDPAWWTLLRVSPQDRKSTRLNSSHGYISYAVFCLKKKKTVTFSCALFMVYVRDIDRTHRV